MRHLATPNGGPDSRAFGSVVSPAVAAEAEQAGAWRWYETEGLPTWERTLVPINLEEVEDAELAGR